MKHLLLVPVCCTLLCVFEPLYPESSFGASLQTTAPPDSTSIRFALDSHFLLARLHLTDTELYSSFNPDIHSWSAFVRAGSSLSLFTGAISPTALPSQVKNPVRKQTSARYRPITPQDRPLVQPGTGTLTEQTGLQIHTPQTRIALVANPLQPNAHPRWFAASHVLQEPLPPQITLSFSFFSGSSPMDKTKSDSWFLPIQSYPAVPIDLHAAQLAISLPFFTMSATGYTNTAPLTPDQRAVHSDVRTGWKWFTIAGSWYRQDPEFLDFSLNHDPIQEQWIIAPAVNLPCPGAGRTRLEFQALYGEDTVSTDTWNEEWQKSAYTSVQGKITNRDFSFHIGARKEGESVDLSIVYKNYHCIYPNLSLTLGASGTTTDSTIEPDRCTNTKITVSSVFKAHRQVRLEASVVRTQKSQESPPDSRFTVSTTLTNREQKKRYLALHVKWNYSSLSNEQLLSIYFKMRLK